MCNECSCDNEGSYDKEFMYNRINAVERRIEQMISGSVDAIQEKTDAVRVNVDAKVAEINKTLFDGLADNITGDELKKLLCVDDALSLDNLLERTDVQDAITLTQDVHIRARISDASLDEKGHAAETVIDDFAQILWDDILIAGAVTPDIINRLVDLEELIRYEVENI